MIGLITKLGVVAVLFHKYVFAPLAFNIVDSPLQITLLVNTAVTVGFGLIVKFIDE